MARWIPGTVHGLSSAERQRLQRGGVCQSTDLADANTALPAAGRTGLYWHDGPRRGAQQHGARERCTLTRVDIFGAARKDSSPLAKVLFGSPRVPKTLAESRAQVLDFSIGAGLSYHLGRNLPQVLQSSELHVAAPGPKRR